MPSNKAKSFFPSLLVLLIASHIVYYWQVLDGTYPKPFWLLMVALVAAMAGYFFGTVIEPTKKRKEVTGAVSVDHVEKTAHICVAVGLLAHVVYYSMNPVSSYGESYGASRGMGFITAFFVLLPVGLILEQFVFAERGATKARSAVAALAIVAFSLAYVFLLMKRRQVLLLLLALLALYGPRIKTSGKVTLCFACAVLFVLFEVFGKVRGYYDANGLAATIPYVISNFDISWLSVDELEGKYISRTLNDVYLWVGSNGLDPSVLLGIVTIFIPRALLGGAKPDAFPSWYTYHFYPADYAAGTGYAGSMVAELYLIGGLLFLLVGYFVFGFVCARVQKSGLAMGDTRGRLIYALFIYTILLLPRYDLASLLVDLVFLYVPVLLATRSHVASPSAQSRKSVASKSVSGLGARRVYGPIDRTR